jgi:hypothetical protein
LKGEGDDRDHEVPDAAVPPERLGAEDAEQPPDRTEQHDPVGKGDPGGAKHGGERHEAKHLAFSCRLEGGGEDLQTCQRTTGDASTTPAYRLTVSETVNGSATPSVKAGGDDRGAGDDSAK